MLPPVLLPLPPVRLHQLQVRGEVADERRGSRAPPDDFADGLGVVLVVVDVEGKERVEHALAGARRTAQDAGLRLHVDHAVGAEPAAARFQAVLADVGLARDEDRHCDSLDT